MAVNNPYAAYQRYATVKPNRNNDRKEEDNLNNGNQITKLDISDPKRHVNSGVDQYRDNSILTANAEDLTLMLYDGAIKFMNQAVEFILNKNIERTHISIVRAQDIFMELRDTLDMNYDISKSLYDLYNFINDNLIEANIKKDSNLLQESIGLTRELRETWAHAISITKRS